MPFGQSANKYRTAVSERRQTEGPRGRIAAEERTREIVNSTPKEADLGKSADVSDGYSSAYGGQLALAIPIARRDLPVIGVREASAPVSMPVVQGGPPHQG